MFEKMYDQLGPILLLTIILFISLFCIDKYDKKYIERRKILIEQHDNFKVYDNCIEYNDKFYCY